MKIYLTINCEKKNLHFEVFRLTLAYFWRLFNYTLLDTGIDLQWF